MSCEYTGNSSSGGVCMSQEEVTKSLYGIRDYIVSGKFHPGWYNEVMDDMDYIFDWLAEIKEVSANE